jgi:catechol 2,3-dioxygenase-like lactoylglutathione lyase family enzyme
MKTKNISKSEEGLNIITGIDHIGINVPDIDTATVFLQQAFGAEIIYESYNKQQPPLELPNETSATLNLAPHAKLHSCRMIKIGKGVNIELFEIHVDGQREPVKSSDFGLQHFAVYTDHITKATEKFVMA